MTRCIDQSFESTHAPIYVFLTGEPGSSISLYRDLPMHISLGVRFIEQGQEPDPQAKKQRAQMLARALRKLGYEVRLTPIKLATA